MSLVPVGAADSKVRLMPLLLLMTAHSRVGRDLSERDYSTAVAVCVVTAVGPSPRSAFLQQ